MGDVGLQQQIGVLPDTFSAPWVEAFCEALEKATWKGQYSFQELLPSPTVVKLLGRAAELLKAEPTLVEVNPPEESATVTVVGDTHGQIHDVLNMFRRAGFPSETSYYVFNGDFVDRGAWGLEVLLVFCAWKLAFPTKVTLLRGNHETTTCTTMYGFKGELEQKFGLPISMAVYAACRKLFALLPLAAHVGGATLVLHGGLFRKPLPASNAKNKRKRGPLVARGAPCELGSLSDLRAAAKGGADPNGRKSTLVATDVLWSDPVATPGLELNLCRGVGTVFGPDVTQTCPLQRFLEHNGLRLVLRSHEGPDARFERDDMPGMQSGWTIDHVVPAGRLLTVFSAPDYPQFQADEAVRYANLAAVAVLTGPTWCAPRMLQYAAVLPRPQATASYEFADVPGSDEEISIAGSDASNASSLSGALDDTAARPATPPTPTEPAAQEALPSPPPRHATRAAAARSLGGAVASASAGAATGSLTAAPTPTAVDAAGSLEQMSSEDNAAPSTRHAGHAAVQPAAQDRVPADGAASRPPSELALDATRHGAGAANGALVEMSLGLTAGDGCAVMPLAPEHGMQPQPSGPFQLDADEKVFLDAEAAKQQPSSSGRELEQAAAMTLAVSGGVDSASPAPPVCGPAAAAEVLKADGPDSAADAGGTTVAPPLESGSSELEPPTAQAGHAAKRPARAHGKAARAGAQKAPWR